MTPKSLLSRPASQGAGSAEPAYPREDVEGASFGSTHSAAPAIKQGEQAADASSGRRGRISALDFTKGALVLVMVLYHWLNYFVGPQGDFYRYLSFLPPSFICITGFLISHVYLSKHRITDVRLARRLSIRGLKISGIFILLNGAISVLVPKSDGGRRLFDTFSLDTLLSAFVTGNMGSGRVAAFAILLPISYLLLLSACLQIACRYYKYVFQLVTVLCVVGIAVLNLYSFKSVNLELLTIGFIGISIGYISIDKINRVLKYPFPIALAYLCYTIAITIWNIPYPLQVVGVLLTLVVIYILGTASGETGRMPGFMIKLGKYSLFGYIAQIAILQLLRRSLPPNLPEWGLVTSFLGAIALTTFAIEAVDRARARAPFVDRLYSAVFA